MVGSEIGFVSRDRRLVDFLAHVFGFEELDAIDIDEALAAQLPAARPGVQYRLQAADGLVVKVTVPVAAPRPDVWTDHVLAGTGLRYVTFYVRDLEAVVARAAASGGVVEQVPMVLFGSRLALVKDPDGNLFELAEVPA